MKKLHSETRFSFQLFSWICNWSSSHARKSFFELGIYSKELLPDRIEHWNCDKLEMFQEVIGIVLNCKVGVALVLLCGVVELATHIFLRDYSLLYSETKQLNVLSYGNLLN